MTADALTRDDVARRQMPLTDADFDVLAPSHTHFVGDGPFICSTVELHGLSRSELNGKRGKARSFDDKKRRMVVDVDGESKPMLVRCRNLRPVAPSLSTPAWVAKYSRADRQRYEVSLSVAVQQGGLGTGMHRNAPDDSLKFTESAIATLSRATSSILEDPRAHGMLSGLYQKKWP